MKLYCKLCKKHIKTTMLEHYKIMHPDYSFPNDWTTVGGEDD